MCRHKYSSLKLIMATKKRGRPATGINPVVGVRLPPTLLSELDRWRLAQNTSLNRPEAIRRLVRERLRTDSQNEYIKNVVSDVKLADNVTISVLPAQCRAARALLDWSQEELVRASGITKKTIADFERGATTPRLQTLAQILAAFEAAAIEFLDGNRPGVRLRQKP